MKIFRLPDLGEGLQEAEVVEWRVQSGQTVAVDDPLLAVETAKAVVEIPSPHAARIERLFAKVGEIVHIGSPLVGFDGAGEEDESAGSIVGAVATGTQVMREAPSSLSAMLPRDVLVPSYRDHAAQLLRGMTMVENLLYWGGDERGNYYAKAPHDFPNCVPVGSHAPHAAGVALALKLRNEPRAVVCIFGDGASSKGAVYEAMNFAGVWKLPVVFVITNNQWAISVPRHEQSAAETLAQKAIAVGIPGEQVDGNDVIAVYVGGAALDHARQGDGAHVIEALTYRLGDHTTADDATRYRDGSRAAAWASEPIGRLPSYLAGTGFWSKDREDALLKQCTAEIDSRGGLSCDARPRSDDVRLLYAALPSHCKPTRGGAALRARRRTAVIGRSAPFHPRSRDNGRNNAGSSCRSGARARDGRRPSGVIVLGEDVGADGGVFRATDGLFKRFGA